VIHRLEFFVVRGHATVRFPITLSVTPLTDSTRDVEKKWHRGATRASDSARSLNRRQRTVVRKQ